MKNTLTIGAALVLSGILIAMALPRKAGAQGQPQRQHEVVVMEAQDYYTVINQGQPNATYTFAGFYVFNLDASPGVPRLASITPQSYPYTVTTNQLATVLARYIALGFTITHTDGHTWTLQN